MKRISKYLAVIMSVVILLSATTSLSLAKNMSGYETGDVVYYGSYPSALVNDEALLDELEANEDLCDENGDLEYGGLRFRKVYFDTCRDDGTGNGTNYQTANGYNPGTSYWFIYEPIAWRVLSEEDGKVLLMAEKIIDSQPYNDKKGAITWKDSSIREWLNGDFMNIAFTEEQQKNIVLTENENQDNPIYGSYNGVPSAFAGDFQGEYPFCGTEGGENTSDLVFLASFDEITDKNYGFNLDWTALDDFGRFAGYYDEDEARKAFSTDYAKCQGVWTNYDSEPVYSRYWLRTPGFNTDFAAGVLEDGRVSTGWKTDYTILGVRPLIYLSSDAEQTPLTIGISDTEIRYKEKGVRLISNMPVTWSSSDPEIASVDENGFVTIHDVGLVSFSATSIDFDPQLTATCDVEISYEWWQWLIRIFLFGWIWY